MSKNADFFKLGPYSCKNSIRTGTGTKIGQTENNRAKLAVPRAREGTSRRLHARLPRALASRVVAVGRPGSVRSARLVLRFGPTCRRHVSTPRWSCVAPVNGRRVSGACRRPPPLAGRFFFFVFLFLLSSLSSKNRNPVCFFFFF